MLHYLLGLSNSGEKCFLCPHDGRSADQHRLLIADVALNGCAGNDDIAGLSSGKALVGHGQQCAAAVTLI